MVVGLHVAEASSSGGGAAEVVVYTNPASDESSLPEC